MQACPVAPPPAPLADQPLVNYRKSRYRGDNICLSMSEFVAQDQVHITEIYRFLERLFAVLKPFHLNGNAETLQVVRSFVAAQELGSLLRNARQMGVASMQSRRSELMAKTVHDLRGGAMTALLGELQLAQLRSLEAADALRLFFLTRDHLKIIRNALLGLDDAKRQADLIPKLHSVDLISEKWRCDLLGANYQRPTHLEVVSDFHGNIAECCVEFGALDRVLYNLVNNACRHTASGEIKLEIFSQPTSDGHPENLRFCVSNPVVPKDEQALAARGDLRQLFEPGISTTGSGFGLTVAMDFVSNAYGLSTAKQAFGGGYLGAAVVDHEFRIWFHWPIVGDV